MTSRKGIKIKREDFKSLKDEIKNIKRNINREIHSVRVFLNEKEDYAWRANKKQIFEKSSQEEKYNLNEILKYHELNKDKYIQGFTSKYFRKLTDLLSKNKYKKYSKERLELYNSRINKSQKIYIEKNDKDSNIKSSLNKKIKNPFITSLYSYNIKNYNYKNENKIIKNNLLSNNYIKNQKAFFSSSISSFSNRVYDKKIAKNKSKSNDFSEWRKQLYKSNKKNKNKFFSKYMSYKNMMEKTIKNGNELENNFSFSYYNKNKINSSKNNMIDGREEFFNDLDKDKYHNFLRSQYQFFDDYYIAKNTMAFELKTKRRRNMFNSSQNNIFLEKSIKDASKTDFFNKIKRQIERENSPIVKISNNNIRFNKNKDRCIPSLSARFLKTMKFNKDCNLIYEKFKKTII